MSHEWDPLPHAPIAMVFGLLEHLRETSGREDLYKLGGPLGLELDDLLPVTEAAKQLGLVKIASGDIELTSEGRRAGGGGSARAQGAAAPPAVRAAPAAPHSGSAAGGGRRAALPKRDFLDLLEEHFSPTEAETPARHRARLGAVRRAVRLRPRHRGVRPHALRPGTPMHKVVLWIQTVLVPTPRAGGHLRRRLPRFLVPQRPRDQRHPGRDLVEPPIPSAPGSTCSWPRWARSRAARPVGAGPPRAGRRSSSGGSASRASSRRGPPSRGGTCWPSPSRRCCPPPMPFKIFVLSAGRLRLSVPPAGPHPRDRARPALHDLGDPGLVYGDEALEWLKPFDRFFADRWPYGRADPGRRRPGPRPRPAPRARPGRRGRARCRPDRKVCYHRAREGFSRMKLTRLGAFSIAVLGLSAVAGGFSAIGCSPAAVDSPTTFASTPRS